MKRPSFRRQIGGIRAKVTGANWETLFENSAWRAGCKVIRIPDGCKVGRGNKLFRVKSPFDFCIIRNGKTIYVDTKSTLGSTFSFSDIDQNQVHWLSHCSAGGCRAGYAVEFRALKKFVFFTVEQLAGLQPRTSLKPEQGLDFSGDGDRLELAALFHERSKEIQRTIDVPAGTCA